MRVRMLLSDIIITLCARVKIKYNIEVLFARAISPNGRRREHASENSCDCCRLN